MYFFFFFLVFSQFEKKKSFLLSSLTFNIWTCSQSEIVAADGIDLLLVRACAWKQRRHRLVGLEEDVVTDVDPINVVVLLQAVDCNPVLSNMRTVSLVSCTKKERQCKHTTPTSW